MNPQRRNRSESQHNRKQLKPGVRRNIWILTAGIAESQESQQVSSAEFILVYLENKLLLLYVI